MVSEESRRRFQGRYRVTQSGSRSFKEFHGGFKDVSEVFVKFHESFLRNSFYSSKASAKPPKTPQERSLSSLELAKTFPKFIWNPFSSGFSGKVQRVSMGFEGASRGCQHSFRKSQRISKSFPGGLRLVVGDFK